MGMVERMFKDGVFETKYTGIIEIYPRRAMNSTLFWAALHEINRTHTIVRISKGYLRAFERKD